MSYQGACGEADIAITHLIALKKPERALAEARLLAAVELPCSHDSRRSAVASVDKKHVQASRRT